MQQSLGFHDFIGNNTNATVNVRIQLNPSSPCERRTQETEF